VRGLPENCSLKQLLVYCYFCPDAPHRPGGVQQIVGPLLSALIESGGWAVSVVHAGPCHATSSHSAFPGYSEIGEPSAVNPDILVEAARRLRTLATNYDVVLSIDRLLPCLLPRPCVLMSNTLSYETEVVAVQADQWARIVVPTTVFAGPVHTVNPSARVCVVPYGLPDEVIERAMSVPPAVWGDSPCIVRLPHRPDPRKGHREAIEGLALALPESRRVKLEISWLDEERYASYRLEIETLAHQLGVAPQVAISSWLDGSEQWQSTADSCAALQLGRFAETFGLSIVESILFGRPVVTRPQPAVREVVGSTELLLEVANPLDWYAALEAYGTHRVRPLSTSRDRHPLAQALSLARMAASYDLILKETVQTH
jgi:glycosyltransferase involved in cell wall biosynthesis